MDETWLVNHIKQRLALVPAQSLEASLTSQNVASLTRRYVLPDQVTSRTGWVLGEDAPPSPPPAPGSEQLLSLGPERFIGEILFRPSDQGLGQMGLGEGALHLLGRAPPAMVAAGGGRLVAVGGCSEMPGFADRFTYEVRCGGDVSSLVCVVNPPSPGLPDDQEVSMLASGVDGVRRLQLSSSSS